MRADCLRKRNLSTASKEADSPSDNSDQIFKIINILFK